MNKNKNSNKKKEFIISIIEEISEQSLFLIRFYSGLSIYAVGTNIKDALASLGLSNDIKSTLRVESFAHLEKLEGVINKSIDMYNRLTCTAGKFTCYFEGYDTQYWLCVNQETGQTIKLH